MCTENNLFSFSGPEILKIIPSLEATHFSSLLPMVKDNEATWPFDIKMTHKRHTKTVSTIGKCHKVNIFLFLLN